MSEEQKNIDAAGTVNKTGEPSAAGTADKAEEPITAVESAESGERAEAGEVIPAAKQEDTDSEALSRWGRWRAKRAARKEEKRRKEEEKSTFQNFCEMVAFAAGAVCVALIIKNYIGQPIIVDGDSMNDTLEDHNVVWANKINYTPERFDVVIVQPDLKEKTLFIKRVIALPGETIWIDKEGTIYIKSADSDKFETLDDPYGYFSGPEFSSIILYPNNADGSYTLGEDEYFCMGDNRYNSKDSRALGAFSAEQIKGHAVLRLWPFTKFGNFDKSNE